MRRHWLATLALLGGVSAYAAQGAGESGHVAPDAPQTHVHAMPHDEMAEMMGMDDRRRFGQLMLDRLEWQGGGDARYEWNASAWYGGDFDKIWMQSEGRHTPDGVEDSRTEIAWDRIVSAWWNLRLGLRHDGGAGPSRDWAALGIGGIAPGLIDVEGGFYLGEGGRTALRFAAHRDYLLTQRLVLQPEAELAVYGRDDPDRAIGAGLSALDLGLRLRYEVRRKFAPYIGVRWSGHFGESATLREAAGEDAREWSGLAGVRAWF